MYGYIATHGKGTTLVLSDGRVFEQHYGRAAWYLTEEGVEIDAWTDQAAQEWDADWRELSEEEVAEEIDLSLSYFIGQNPR